MKTLAPLLWFWFSSAALAAGFEKGNDTQLVPLSGDVIVQCQSGSQSANTHFYCNATWVDPTSQDFFVYGGPAPAADTVTLTATWADGSAATQSRGFDSAKGRSVKRFNLYISTLLQSPLLGKGVNQVAYKLLKGGATVAQGKFTATALPGAERVCPFDSYFSGILQDCQSSLVACERYFQQHDYCR